MTIAHAPKSTAPRHRARSSRAAPSPLDAARALAPVVRGFADETERGRRLPPALVRQLAEAGLFRMAVPRELGGAQADPLTVARVVEELARGDGSAAWCVMLASQVASGAGFMPAAGAREVFGEPGAVASGVARPTGRAEIVDGGYRASGRWPFASGSTHATWLAGECVVTRDGEPVTDEQGRSVVLMMFFPRAQCVVHDTWHTTGLRGTGSNDFSVEDALVPATRAYRIHVDPPVHPWPLYRAVPLIYLGHGAHALGVARAAIDGVIAMAAAKPSMADEKRVQAQIAEALALVDSARAYLYGAAETLWRAVLAGGDGTPSERAAVRLAVSHALRSGVQATELMYRTAGTGAIFSDGALDRPMRDIQTAAAHAMVAPFTYEAAGRVALGREAGVLLF